MSPLDIHPPVPRSAMPGITWPAFPAELAAQQFTWLYQLQATEWWEPQRLRAWQLRQLRVLIDHARVHVPWYRERIGQYVLPPSGLDEATLASLPVLSRAEAQQHSASLKSAAPPDAHGKVLSGATSGSTGTPLQFHNTEFGGFIWHATTLREHFWHRRDLTGKLASIRAGSTTARVPDWGFSTRPMRTGPAVQFDLRAPIADQFAWLQAEMPDYLITYPSNLRALAQHALDRGESLPGLRQARTLGEVLNADTRQLIRSAFEVSVADLYSASEVGYLALNCPEVDSHYHVQAETCLVEILDAAGRTCAEGEPGRVVVSVLHNFAMPLIRYELGDYATPGGPCACGRGLPLLREILGRERNMLRRPNGERFWPSAPAEAWLEAAPVRQFQVVQETLDGLLVRVVVDGAFTPAEQSAVAQMLQQRLGYPYRLRFERVAAIERSKSGKYEDFVCRLEIG